MINLPGFNPTWVAIAVIILAVIQVALLNRDVERLQNTHANIVPGSFEDELVETFINKTKSTEEVVLDRSIIVVTSYDLFELPRYPIQNMNIESKRGKKYKRFYIQLLNEKAEKINLRDSEPLLAKLEYFDNNLKSIFKHQQPYWQDRKPGYQPILRTNGSPENLCLAIQEYGGKKLDLYAFAYKLSYPKNSLEPINEKLLICKVNDTVYVKITISGGNTGRNSPIWIVIKNDIEGVSPNLIDDPIDYLGAER